MDPFIGQVIMFAGNFAPRGWAFCDGQLLAIANYNALFSILGTTYGGDGRTTFGLPDLRGRVPVHPGSGPGLSTYKLGQKGGAENVTLNVNQIPAHNHPSELTLNAGNTAPATKNAANNILASSAIYGTGTADVAMNPGSIAGSIGNTGGGQGHTNVQPFNCVNYIIALEGTYPSRS